jgi:CubicO group peptidase (beta-lactamase class C family)
MNGGFSKARLTRMQGRMSGHVERGYVPGIVTLVSRRGDTHVHAVGRKTLDRGDPMRRDTIFRITSMTKPITAVATMILVEDCKLRLDEPIERLLPELANRRVLKSLESPALDLYDGVEDTRWNRPPRFPDGGAGLVSTIDDYLAFGQMLLKEGRYGSERILSRPSIVLMTADHLTAEQKVRSAFVPGHWDNHGWGFGVQVVTRRDDVSAVPGQYGWDGGFGTSWRTDPQEDLVAILMTQRAEFPLFSPVHQDF